MQSTIRHSINASIQNPFYRSDGHALPNSVGAGDFLLRSDSGEPSPIIFLNNQLPEILQCISSELTALQREKSLCGKSLRLDTHMKSAPLFHWYRSVLANTYSDYPIHLNRKSTAGKLIVGQTLSAFCLRGDIYPLTRLPSGSSSLLYYVTPVLPPLWQKRNAPSLIRCSHSDYDDNVDNDDADDAGPCFIGSRFSERKYCFSFHYCAASECWYVTVFRNTLVRLKRNEI